MSKQKVLILGGTQFVGRNLVEALIKHDEYELTLFNRQQTNANLFPEINKIKGDRRSADIAKIAATNWDYIIDISAYYPNYLKQVLKQVNPSLKRYVFVSTCSVYPLQLGVEMQTESNEILTCSDAEAVEETLQTYGKRKAECERVLVESGLPYVALRPALIYGKYDPTDRFYYWLHQVKTQKMLLLPEGGQPFFSVTYVDDLVRLMIDLLEPDALPSSAYNVVSNPQMCIKTIVDTTAEIMGIQFKSINASADFLKENKVSQWMNMPLWVNGNHFTFDNKAALAEANFTITDFKQSVAQTLAYYNTLGWQKPTYGLSEEKKMELLNQL